MEGENSANAGSLQRQIDLLTIEYKELKAEASNRVSRQSQVFTLCITIIGAVAAALATLPGTHLTEVSAPHTIGEHLNLLLIACCIVAFVPFVTTPLAFVFFDDELMIFAAENYINCRLRPMIRRLAAGGEHPVSEVQFLAATFASRAQHIRKHLIDHFDIAKGRWLLFQLPFVAAWASASAVLVGVAASLRSPLTYRPDTFLTWPPLILCGIYLAALCPTFFLEAKLRRVMWAAEMIRDADWDGAALPVDAVRNRRNLLNMTRACRTREKTANTKHILKFIEVLGDRSRDPAKTLCMHDQLECMKYLRRNGALNLIPKESRIIRDLTGFECLWLRWVGRLPLTRNIKAANAGEETFIEAFSCWYRSGMEQGFAKTARATDPCYTRRQIDQEKTLISPQRK